MEPSKYLKLSNEILDNPTERYCEIYKITNIKNNKIYVGQCVSHILNHKRYRPYGHQRRFNTHVSETFSQKKNQSYYLNNAIKKHGVENFMVEILEYCELKHSDDREFIILQI
jgi:group I intron endonuclease